MGGFGCKGVADMGGFVEVVGCEGAKFWPGLGGR